MATAESIQLARQLLQAREAKLAAQLALNEASSAYIDAETAFLEGMARAEREVGNLVVDGVVILPTDDWMERKPGSVRVEFHTAEVVS